VSKAANVWVVDDDRSIRWVLQKALESVDINVHVFENAQQVIEQLDKTVPDVLVSDIRMPGMDGLQLLANIQESHPDLPVIIMTAYSDLDSAVSVYEGGAFE
jgi:two-component system nitrogen regulation response regulator GlnG